MKKVNFDEVLENLQATPIAPSKPEFILPKVEAFEGFFRQVEQSIEELQNGTSALRRGGIHFPKGICVPLIWMERFKKTPSLKALRSFIILSEQDLGGKAKDLYLKWLEELCPGVSKELK